MTHSSKPVAQHTIYDTLMVAAVLFFLLVSSVSAAPTIGDTSTKATLGNDLIGGSKYIYSVQGLSIATTTTSTAAIVFSDGTIQTTAFSESGTGTLSAGQITPGTFGSIGPNWGSYTFKDSAGTDIILYIDAAGEYVGIGTGSPGALLHTAGGNVFIDTSTGTYGLYITRQGAANQALKIYTDDVNAIFETIQDENTAGYAGYRFRMGSQASQDPSFQIIDYTSGSDSVIMRVGADGKVGIGTASPATKLHISNNGLLQMTYENTATGATNNIVDYIAKVKDDAGNLEIASLIRSSLTTITNGAEVSRLDFQTLDAGVRADRMSIKGSNVGIGTSTPSSALHVYKSAAGAGIIGMFENPSGASFITIKGAADTLGGLLTFQNQTGTQRWQVGMENLPAAVVGDFIIGQTNNQDPPNFIIETSGDVGIGTANPSYKLEVVGNLHSTGNITADGSITADISAASVTPGEFGSIGSQWSNYWFKDSTGVNTVLYIDAGNERVGIGTGTPTNTLHVNASSTGNLVRFENDSTGGNDSSIRFRAKDSAGNFAHMDFGIKATGVETGYFYFKAPYNQSERMVINTAGDVGIGTTGPVENLEVSGSLQAAGHKWYTGKEQVPTGVGSAYYYTMNLNNEDGETLQTDWHYKISITVVGTGTDSGASYIVYYDQAAGNWVAREVSRSGTSSNHPQIYISGSNVRGYDEHTGPYNHRYTVESIYKEQVDGSAHALFSDFQWQRTGTALSYVDGNVGIGTAGPSNTLEVAGAGVMGIDIDSSNSNSQLRLLAAGTQKWNIYNAPSAHDFYIADDGDNTRFFIRQSDGNVGIGTVSPGATLEVNGDVIFNGLKYYYQETWPDNISGNAGRWIKLVTFTMSSGLYRRTNLYGVAISAGDDQDRGVEEIHVSKYGGTTAAAYLMLKQNTTTGYFRTLKLISNDANLLTYELWGQIDTGWSGNLGIEWRYDDSYNAATPSFVEGYQLSQSSEPTGTQYNASESRTIIAAVNGNVGIGTTNPGYKLEVSGGDLYITGGALGVNVAPSTTDGSITANSWIKSNSNVYAVGGNGFVFGASTGEGEYIYRSGNDIRILAGGSDRLTIDGDAGRVGIGTTAPDTKLQVVGGVHIGDTMSSYNIKTGRLTISGGGGEIDLQDRSTGTGAWSTTDRWVIYHDSNILRWYRNGLDRMQLTEAGKLNVSTIDPIYTIDGIRYATYMIGMTGVKEETTGVVRLSTQNQEPGTRNQKLYEYVIDFDELEIGSDIWLFAQTVNVDGRAHITENGTIYRTTSEELFDNMTILLTPGFEGDVWYEKNAENKQVVIYAQLKEVELPSIETLEVSYRLTAPRFDWKYWKNTTDDEMEGLNLDKLLQ